MSDASNIQSDSFVQLARLLNDEGVWSMDLGQERGGGVEGISPKLLVAEPEERKVLVDISVQAGRDAAVVPGPHVDLALAPEPALVGVQLTEEEGRDVINITMFFTALLADSCETDTCGQSLSSRCTNK